MDGPTLTFLHGFDDRTAFEVEAKGYYANAMVHLPGGQTFRAGGASLKCLALRVAYPCGVCKGGLFLFRFDSNI